MLSGYKDSPVFGIVSFEFSFRPERWKVPVTTDLNIIMEKSDVMSYQSIQVTCWRTNGKETKAYPIIRTPTHFANWGLPKLERQKWLCVMPQGDKSQV
jgi:hypothetical protein